MNTAQEHELTFWRQVIQDVGVANYRDYREADFQYHFGNFMGTCDLSRGLGLEIGVGLGSLLQFAGTEQSYYAVDPLMHEFLVMDSYEHQGWYPRCGDGENLPEFADGEFDWVVCWNVIDHTPQPERMVSEMHRVLRGKLYLYLNFDDNLSPCHYALWDKTTVENYFGELFNITWENFVRVEEWKQTKYYAVLEKK